VRPPFRVIVWLFTLLAVALPTAARAQFRYPPYYPYPVYYGYPDSSLRIKVKPKDASVYVDGYYAGRVEDYDGAFQRLHVPPGQHEIIVYLDGFRSLHERLYLPPNSTKKIEGELEKLLPGDAAEPLPQPTTPPPPPQIPGANRPPMAGRGTPRPLPPPPPGGQPPPPSSTNESRFGTISLQVQPSGATVFVDGERWSGPANPDERLIIQVPVGRHHVEVEHDGYERFITEIDVRASDTAPLNISLARTR
jgi:PEGA domain-containing protein